MVGLPQDSSHLSDVSTELMIEQYAGGVETQFYKEAGLRDLVPVRAVRGTDTITNNRVGRTRLQKLQPGVRPDATTTGFGKVSLTVDTVVLARDNRSMLNEFQTHFDARMELARDHGKELAKYFDQAFIIMAIKGAGMSAPSGLNGAIGAGKTVTLSAANDENDPDKLHDAIEGRIVAMREEDIDVEELVVMVRPTQYAVLKKHGKLLNKDYSTGNGDFAKHQVETIAGARIMETSRIPTAAITGHFLSNPENGNAYDVSATEAKAVAVILHPKSLFAGETIPLQSDVYFDKIEKQWFIDSWMSFAVTVNRPDVCGRVLKA